MSPSVGPKEQAKGTAEGSHQPTARHPCGMWGGGNSSKWGGGCGLWGAAMVVWDLLHPFG